MKKNILITLLAAMLLSSCGEYNNLLDTVYNDENRIPTNNYFLEHPERIIHTTAKLDTADRLA